jgi:2-polyprenyl-6-methoxyphenol hydroxylase-like FAD-dependent oxidoreductase
MKPLNFMTCYAKVLDTIGLSESLMQSGIHAKGMTFYGGVDKLLEINISQLHEETNFPNILMISQPHVERIFEERLASEGIKVFRNQNAVGIKEVPGNGLEVTFEDGGLLKAKYVVGADGSRSTVSILVHRVLFTLRGKITMSTDSSPRGH